MPAPPPTSLTLPSSSSPLPTISNLSLLPFQISKSTSAHISTYFNPRTRTSTSLKRGAPADVEEAAFRGRLVVGTKVDLGEGYSGLVLETKVPAPPTERRQPEERQVKKVKVQVEKKVTVPLAPLGRRTSPRKKKVVPEKQKFSMDSDEEEEQEGNASTSAAVAEVVKEEEEDVQLETTTVTTTTIITEPISSSTLPALSTSSSLLSLPSTPLPLTDPEPSLTRDIRHLTPLATFSSIRIWNPDMELDEEEDLFCRGIGEWLGVAGKIHAY